jgi:FAD/FMN-containing dehydrogenase/Fe-S oxidoreductase
VEHKPSRLIEDLADSLDGEIRSDRATLAMYSTDASLYQIEPQAVAFPKSRDDVVTLAQYATQTETSLVPRGAGSGVAGGAIGEGIVVDFSKHMTDIIDFDGKTVRVQPGIVRDRLNVWLREHGRYFPPDPSNSSVTTIGSMLAIDAAGSHAVRVGSTRNHVQSIEVVLANGDVFEAGQAGTVFGSDKSMTRVGPDDSAVMKAPTVDRQRTIVSRLAKLLEDNAGLIDQHQPSLPRNCSGYNLRGVLSEDVIDLPRLLVGSEGTLGLFTEASLYTAPLPKHRGVVLLLFGNIEGAVSAVQKIAPQQPSACDLMGRRLLSLAREADVRFAEMIPAMAEAVVLVEQTGFSDEEVRKRIDETIRIVRSDNPRVRVARKGFTPDEVDFLWSLPTRVVPRLIGIEGESRPLPFIEDIAVPPAAIAEFLKEAQRIFQRHQVSATLYAHAASGQLHLRPFLPFPKEEDAPTIEALANEVYEQVFKFGGTISGEHGDGLARTSFVRKQYGPLYAAFQQVKEIFDPHHLLNPGKIVSEDRRLTSRNFRIYPPEIPVISDLQLTWTPAQISQTLLRCNGCAVCRTQEPDTRMCPFFRAAPDELASPRARANVVRGLLTSGDPETFASDELKSLTDLCFNCKQCEDECPSHVDIPSLMTEARSAYVSANGLDRVSWLLSRMHEVGRIASVFSPVSNRLLTSRFGRWFLEKTVGITRHRRLPRFTSQPFLSRRSVKRPPEKRHGREVLYFVDYYPNFHDPELSEAFVRVLDHNGVHVRIPQSQTASGMAMIAVGDLRGARRIARENLRTLVEPAREGMQIVCTEPSAAVCLKQEYPKLLDTEDAHIVAKQTIEAGQYLASLHAVGQLRTDLAPLEIDVAYHTPCHLRSLDKGTPLQQLMQLIPQIRVHTIEKGCSGMAGTYGLQKRNFEASMEMGRELLQTIDEGNFVTATSECSTCRMQIAQGTNKSTIHPLKLLAYAYGLMPELESIIASQQKGLIKT